MQPQLDFNSLWKLQHWNCSLGTQRFSLQPPLTLWSIKRFPHQESACVVQESGLIDRGEDEGLDDPADSPLPEEKPKIQVG